MMVADITGTSTVWSTLEISESVNVLERKRFILEDANSALDTKIVWLLVMMWSLRRNFFSYYVFNWELSFSY